MITQLDFLILNFIQTIRTPVIDKLMCVLTYLGEGGAVWIALGIVFLFFKKYRKTGMRVIISLIFSAVVFTLIVKNAVGRERPFNSGGGLLNASMLLTGAPIDRYSFPSGHTVSSFSAAVSVFISDKRLGTICLVLASLISLSRLYLYVHFPSDVIFGVIFGIFSAWAVKCVENKLSAFAGRRNRKN